MDGIGNEPVRDTTHGLQEPSGGGEETSGARAEAETLEQGPELAAFRREVSEGIRRISGTGGVRDIHAEG
jgi:hypothetical protein